MTNKVQISWKLPGGEILVVGGEDAQEFRSNAESLGLSNAIQGILFEVGTGMHEPAETGSVPAAAPVRTQQALPGEEKSIIVESISLASGGDHPRWVVKGEWASQYGITCWPEVLETAGLLAHMDPLKDNRPAKTWRAYYVEKERNGEMKADKVVRLVEE